MDKGMVCVCLKGGLVQEVIIGGVAPFDEHAPIDHYNYASTEEYEAAVNEMGAQADELDKLAAEREMSAVKLLEEIINTDNLICYCEGKCDCIYGQAVALINGAAEKKGE